MDPRIKYGFIFFICILGIAAIVTLILILSKGNNTAPVTTAPAAIVPTKEGMINLNQKNKLRNY